MTWSSLNFQWSGTAVRLTLADAAGYGKWLIWLPTDIHMEHFGKVVAPAQEVDHQSDKLLPGAPDADTLVETRAMLPTEMTRCDRTSALPGALETWD